MDAGAPVAFGTDWFVEPLDPMLGLYAARVAGTEVLADGQRVRLTWKPQHTFVIGPAAGSESVKDLELEEPQTDA